MPKVSLSKTDKGPIEERIKSQTATVKGTITLDQKEAIQNLIGVIGSNEQDVVGKILTIWLYNEGYLGEEK